MRRHIFRFLKISLTALVGYFGVVFGLGWHNDWVPEATTSLPLVGQAMPTLPADSTLSLVIWNVGYGGLGAESDFFYDDEGMWYSGSSMIRAPRELVEKNLRGAVDFLKNTPADFFLLQEVDVASDRSYGIRQFDAYAAALPQHVGSMALNYHCPRVPIPLLEPWHAYGQVESGLGTFCRFRPVEVTRFQLPGEYPMPDRIFQLDRCAAVHRFAARGDKQLIIINIHNSAYDPGDRIKAQQMEFLRQMVLREYAAGHYVVLGGDWNQCPPNFRFDQFISAEGGYEQGNVPLDFFPEDWTFAYDPTTPTNRKLRDPYEKGKTFETLIDYFVVSPNVQVQRVSGVAQGFAFSDHQPVRLEIRLR
jgi:endonuclease/exonuclease/phosphatase family metal-dependent hydrolase